MYLSVQEINRKKTSGKDLTWAEASQVRPVQDSSRPSLASPSASLASFGPSWAKPAATLLAERGRTSRVGRTWPVAEAPGHQRAPLTFSLGCFPEWAFGPPADRRCWPTSGRAAFALRARPSPPGRRRPIRAAPLLRPKLQRYRGLPFARQAQIQGQADGPASFGRHHADWSR